MAKVVLKSAVRRVLGLVCVLVLIGWAAWTWVWPLGVRFLVRTDTITSGSLYSHTALSGFLVRDETVVYAPASGVFVRHLKEGDRVGRDGAVGRLVGTDATQEVRAPRGGVVCYRIDGHEQILLPGDGPGLVEPPKGLSVAASGNAPVSRGEAVFKVVDNLGPVYVQFAVPDGLLPRDMLARGAAWRLGWEDEVYPGWVTDLLPGAGGVTLRLRLERYPPEFMSLRRPDFRVITREFNGYIVPRAAIALRGGRPGVFIEYKGNARWVPVVIEGQIGRETLISGAGLAPGVRFVTNPWLIRD